ncbi:MAG: alpha-1,2-fucosyltransferase [Patescibacteria group bacterium]
MIILRLEGGLGNLMFQYALGRHLALKNQMELKFDIGSYQTNPLGDCSFWLEGFGIDIKTNLATQNEIQRFKKYDRRPGGKWFLYNWLMASPSKYVREKGFAFDPMVLEIKGSFYLHGWFQTEKYFKDIREIILKDFTVQRHPLDKNKEVAKKIATTHSIGIHIRRADYVANPKTRYYHGELPRAYYDNALVIITTKIPRPTLFIFSDDIEWVKHNMRFPFETVYTGWNAMEAAHEDVRLMSLCKHNIISNSTLGWWGAWLNKNNDKIVVAPSKWFANSPKCDTKDIVPENWHTVEPCFITK